MDDSLSLTARGEADALEAWLRRHSLLMLAAGAAAVATGQGAWAALGAAVSFGTLGLLHGRSGLANRITAARLVGVVLVALMLHRLPYGWVVAVLAANVAADYLDGYIARRRRETTPFGTVFDREVDGVFVLVVYLFFVLRLEAHAWFIGLGLLPYAYHLVNAWLAIPLPPDHKERTAAWLAGANFVVLIAALFFPEQAHDLLLASAVVVLASFSLSFVTMLRHARSLPQ